VLDVELDDVVILRRVERRGVIREVERIALRRS